MTEFIALTLAFLSGSALSLMFYGGLWLTVRKVIAIKRQPLWLPAGLFIRILLTLLGFWIICCANNMSFVACIAGFILTRLLVLKLVFVWKRKDTFVVREVIKNAPQS